MSARPTRVALWIGLMASGVSITAASSAAALSSTINATAAGWFREDGTHNAANGNYLTGWSIDAEFRDFFLFDLSPVNGVVTSATLRVNSAQVFASDPSETVGFYDVTTPAAALQVSQSGRTDIFTDLGDGTSYGSVTVTSALYYNNLDVPLNASAIAAINAALGGTFAIGGTVTTLSKPANDEEDVFANSSNFLARQLMLTYVGCTPAPLVGCRSAQKSLIALKDNSDDAKDKVLWKWQKGSATQPELADPTGTTGYALCIYAGTAGTRIAEYPIPGGAHWQLLGSKGYRYGDSTGSAAGVEKIILKGSTSGKAKALLKGSGTNLPDPTLGDVPLPVTAQLVNQDTGLCLQGVYDGNAVILNDARHFKAKAQ